MIGGINRKQIWYEDNFVAVPIERGVSRLGKVAQSQNLHIGYDRMTLLKISSPEEGSKSKRRNPEKETEE